MVIPTVKILTATTTYNAPVGCKYIKVYIIGSGGDGGAGAATGVNAQASGGGAGLVLLRYFNAGSYALTVTAGGSTVFNGVTAFGGNNGTNSGTLSSGGVTGSIGSDFPNQQYCTPGITAGEINTSGNGGAGMFSSGGRGSYNTTGTNSGTSGLGIGGGGGGGNGSAATGGTGSTGGVVIIEYY